MKYKYLKKMKGSGPKLIEPYLNKRKQRLKIWDTYSNYTNTACGVPQGIVLGPILFYSISKTLLKQVTVETTFGSVLIQ